MFSKRYRVIPVEPDGNISGGNVLSAYTIKFRNRKSAEREAGSMNAMTALYRRLGADTTYTWRVFDEKEGRLI